MTEGELLKMRADGQHAKALLNDETLKAAFASIEAAYLDAWRASGSADVNMRERLFMAVSIVGKVRAHLETALTNGELAEHQIAELGEEEKRKRLFGII